MLTTSGFIRTAKQIAIHSTTASAFCGATHVLRCKANSFIFRFPLPILDLNGSTQTIWLREALRWKARKGGSRWGRGGKKASL